MMIEPVVESACAGTLLTQHADLASRRPHGSSEVLTAAVRLGRSLRSLGQKRIAEAGIETA
jgi:hypothetical protein